MTNKINLEKKHLDVVKKLLDIYLSNDTQAKVYIFGSRVTNTAKDFSDIDIAINAGKKLSLSDLANLKDDFDNSILPYNVDIVDINDISEDFKNHILTTAVLLAK